MHLISRSFFLLFSLLILLGGQLAFACNAVIHSFVQSGSSTQGGLTYSCWGSYYCKIEIRKNGVVQLDAVISQGNFQAYAFNYGEGDFVISVKSFLKVPTSGGGFMPILQSDSSINVKIRSGIGSTMNATKYTYDALGRLKTVEEYGGKTTTYNYDAADNRTSKHVSN